MRVRATLLLLGGAVVVAALPVIIRGSIVLLDFQREVSSAQVVDSFGTRRDLLDLGIVYVGVPKTDGAVRIKCANGEIIRGGYVSRGMTTWQGMAKYGECSVMPS